LTEAIDQLLFGYRDGHELIAGSRPLSSAQLRDVLPHVDASVEHRDERQLVGTWIPSLEGYLLARIWAAPERPRPGAVWAHALVLSAAQLQRDGLASLLALLTRPSGAPPESYETQLPWPIAGRLTGAPQLLAQELVAAACAPDVHSRVVLWPAPTEAEGALVALLAAFPPAQRSELSFRTREQVRPGPSPYRVQVAAFLSGQANELVIDMRKSRAAA
jgi:hypothetical protein